MKKGRFLIAVFLTIAVMAGASDAGDLTGKDIAESGSLLMVSGTLKNIDGELFLESDNGLYQLHLGPEWYAEEIGFQRTEGASATIEGYFVDTYAVPKVISVDGKKYIFRDDSRRPMWSGNENNTNGRYNAENWIDGNDDCDD